MAANSLQRLQRTLALFPKAIWIALVRNRAQLFVDWVVLPVVVLAMLVYVWAINLAVSKLPFSFPPSVAAMILAFLVLLLSSVTLGRQRTAVPLKYLEPVSDFLLKWISIFFCPSFILLPIEENHTSITGIEIVKIIALFLVSFVVFVVLTWAVVKLLMFISPFKSRDEREKTEDDDPIEDALEMNSIAPVPSIQAEAGLISTNGDAASSSGVDSALPRPAPAAIRQHHGVPYVTIDEAAVAPTPTSALSRVGSMYELDQSTAPQTPVFSPSGSQITLVPPPIPANAGPKRDTLYPVLPPAEQLAERITPFIPTVVYGLLFLVSLPVFYTTPQSLPLFLAWNVLCYLFAVLAVPLKLRRFLHPIITCSVLSVLGIWAMGAIKGWSLDTSLNAYSTNSRYLVLFDPSSTGKVAAPGAGDVLYSVLDACIVSLAIPMYRYRGELKRHAFEMFATTIPLAVLSLFIYPLIARAIRLAPHLGLAFAARSVTTPLAIPMEATLKGDPGLTVVLCILTGVLGAMAGPTLLRWLRVKDDDFITIGIVLGCTASAISTAALLGSNPRAAAISSLAFVLYGVACIVLSAIPPVVEIVQTLAGL